MTFEHAFLKVNRSFGGRRWIARPSDERTALALAQGYGLPELVGRVLSARGIDLSTADAFLTPKLKSLLPDPSHLKDMDAAASRIARAIMDGERVAVFGDYDVDGATSSALLRRFFRAAGSDLTVYIPDRIAEGYGPNAPALLRLKSDGVSLVVTVDCGVTSFDPLAAAADAGLEVVVIDHHAAEPRLPRAVAVVNPNRKDDASPHKTLAAVGVTFLLVVALNRALRTAGWWNDRRPAPDLLNWL
ncbi:MAG TPA: DHH family phosphoesterase, partial [Skermanella sp.]|nr:DHH family phosphoesterase [Skermanella sp.]